MGYNNRNLLYQNSKMHKSSATSINESIHSTTHPLLIMQSSDQHNSSQQRLQLSQQKKHNMEKTMPAKTRNQASSQNRIVHEREVSSKPAANLMMSVDQQTFTRYYEQNIMLKKQKDEMAKQLQQLQHKLQQSEKVRKEVQEHELRMLATGKRSIWDNQNSVKQPRGLSAKPGRSKPANDKKVQDLLEIIDHYKQKMMTAESEITNLNRQKHLLEQDKRISERKVDKYQKSSHQAGTADHDKLASQLKTTIRSLQLQKQRNRYNQAQVKRLQTKLKTSQINKEQYQQLQNTNRSLQEQLMRLTNLPSFNSVNDSAELERKLKELENKCKTMNEKYTQARNVKIKLEAEIKVLQNRLIQVNKEADLLEKENEKLKSQRFLDPILIKLSQNQTLLTKVFYEFESALEKEREGDGDARSSAFAKDRPSYQQIIFEKQALANEITVLRSKIDSMQEHWREKQRLAKIQKEELLEIYKDRSSGIASVQMSGTKVMSQNGVPYSQSVSMFTQDPHSAPIPNGYNFFDLYLGELHMLETMLKTMFSIYNPESTLILATIDFYNHDTESTRPVHSISNNLQSQFSFKIYEDEFYFKYLRKGTLHVDIWGLEGNKRHHFGRATAELRDLISKSKKGVAPVVGSSAPVILNQRVMGSINYTMRMRLPIHDKIQRINELGQMLSTEEQSVSRRLIIHIEQGRGFAQSANTFVYYPFRLQDHYTKTYRGNNPIWNHYKSLEVKYNNDLKNYLRKNQLELIVFDDNAVMSGSDASDLVGNGYISLLPLLENKTIKERVQIMKGAHKVATIDIKVFWHDSNIERQKQGDKPIDIAVTSEAIHQKIIEYLNQKGMKLEEAFQQIDKNGSGMISYEQFLMWTTKILSDTPLESLNKFYSKFKQPVNLVNWVNKLREISAEKQELASQFSRINKQMFRHTSEIAMKQSLKEFMRGKELMNVALEIDKNENGTITRQELQQYFDEHGISEQIEGDSMEIVGFLKKYKELGT